MSNKYIDDVDIRDIHAANEAMMYRLKHERTRSKPQHDKDGNLLLDITKMYHSLLHTLKEINTFDDFSNIAESINELKNYVKKIHKKNPSFSTELPEVYIKILEEEFQRKLHKFTTNIGGKRRRNVKKNAFRKTVRKRKTIRRRKTIRKRKTIRRQ